MKLVLVPVEATAVMASAGYCQITQRIEQDDHDLRTAYAAMLAAAPAIDYDAMAVEVLSAIAVAEGYHPDAWEDWQVSFMSAALRATFERAP